MTLSRLKLINFQRHERLEIEFSPGVNFLVGETDAGKSTVLRALRWLTLNAPHGAKFLRRGADACKVIGTIDGRKVVRSKSKANTYSLDGQKFSAVRSDVPGELADLFRMSEENFQRQISLPYWFCLSPGQVSKELNAIIRLDIIDDSLAAAASEQRKAKTILEVTQSRLSAAQEKVKQLEYVGTLDALLTDVETVQKALSDKRARIAYNEKTLKDASVALEKRDRLSNANVAMGKGASSLSVDAGKLKALRDRIRTGEELLCDLTRKTAEVAATNTSLAACEKQMHQLGRSCPLCGAIWATPSSPS